MKKNACLIGRMVLAFFLISCAVQAKTLKVVTTVTELAWLAKQVGGEKVQAESLLEGLENPHYVDAVPSFILKTAEADLVFVVGLDLEVGWIPKVLARSGNAKVQPGGTGYVEVGKFVSVLDKPKGKIDRSMGDVHPGGNPHFWLSPLALIEASKGVLDALSGAAPEHTEMFMRNQKTFSSRMSELVDANKAKFAKVPHPQPWLMEYHQEFSYFLSAYGLKSFGSVEEKPGVAPSAGRLAQVSISAKAAGVKALLVADYAPHQTVARFTELSGVASATVPTSIRKTGKFSDYVVLHNHIVDTLIGAVTKNAAAE